MFAQAQQQNSNHWLEKSAGRATLASTHAVIAGHLRMRNHEVEKNDE
jgi:hypothetical protein